MSYFIDIQHILPVAFASGSSPQAYGAVVGTVEASTEHQIVGQSGTHLQFNIRVSPTVQYQVDVNVQSEDGSEVMMYIGDETLQEQAGSTPFGDPAYGVYHDAELSYASMGLQNAQFVSTPDTRVEQQLEAALNAATFVAAFGMMFNDGGPNGTGIHEIHFDPPGPNQDGALAVYSAVAGGPPTRRWFFFKFDDQTIAG